MHSTNLKAEAGGLNHTSWGPNYLRYSRFIHEFYSHLFSVVYFVVPFSPKTPLGPSRRSTDHFPGLLASAQGPRMASRWKDEWEEIEFLVSFVIKYTNMAHPHD